MAGRNRRFHPQSLSFDRNPDQVHKTQEGILHLTLPDQPV
ncbi:hypothetical protein VDG1235_1988 [Verrucomicrobiia bacterium DG1235]|nr:hypothetical protein VDG1235_1988 [Verrucomicrobiae bacterium DG1235]